MNEPTKVLNPPLKVNNVEIHYINQPDQQLNLTIHVPVHPNFLQTLQVQSWIARQIRMAYIYLELEGFISNVATGHWQHRATAILHPPLKSL